MIGLQEPRATRLPQIPGVGGAAAAAASGAAAAGGGGVEGVVSDGKVSCIAVLEPRYTLSSGLEVGGAALFDDSRQLLDNLDDFATRHTNVIIIYVFNCLGNKKSGSMLY